MAATVAAAGVEYQQITEPGPQSIHVVSFDLTDPALAVAATVGAGVCGIETVPDLVANLLPALRTPIAAINGDFFEYRGEPRYLGTLQGLCIADGALVAAPPASAFWVGNDGRPQIGQVASALRIVWPDGRETPFGINCSSRDFRSEVRTADVVLFTPAFGATTHAATGAREYVLQRPNPDTPWMPPHPNGVYTARIREVCTTGDTLIPRDGLVLSIARAAGATVPIAGVGEALTLRLTCTPDLTGVPAAISGAPMLLKDGRLLTRPDMNRAPRTAIGMAGTRVWFVVVDGRRPVRAVGMSLHELAELMLRLGCVDALNLDGGGSSTLYYDGKIVNTPSDGQPRPVGNALVLLQRLAKTPAIRPQESERTSPQ